MTDSDTCLLPGCSKPRWPSPCSAEPHLACGNLHHQLLMAGRFNPVLPHPYQQVLDLNAAGLCALPSCRDPPYPGHSWCSRSHYLLWLYDFTTSLLPEQTCKLPGCVRHVFVDNNSKPSEFCGWRHCQEYVMRSALECQHLPKQQCLPSALECQHLPKQQCLPSATSSVESRCGDVPSIESLVRSLKDYALHAKTPKSIKVEEDFFNMHPWDVCTEEGHTVLLIVKSKYRSKRKRELVTKDGYHWKQQGRPRKSSSNITQKYFTYRKLKGKQDKAPDVHDGCTYLMYEYTIEAVSDCSLIKLYRRNGNHCKRRPVTGNRLFCADVNDECSQNTNGDEMAVEGFSWDDLSPLDNWASVVDDILASRVSIQDW